METVVLSAHATGALIAALWCHARRGSLPADALIMASPVAAGWLVAGPGVAGGPGAAPGPLLAVLRRRVRRGLDISCPVLVLCPSAGLGRARRPGRPARSAGAPGGRATMRLGPHVTWLRLKVGQARPCPTARAAGGYWTSWAAGWAPTCPARSAISCCSGRGSAGAGP